MFWKNLRNNRCPQCGKQLTPNPLGTIIGCHNCHFTITPKRMQEIVNNMNENLNNDISEDSENDDMF